LGADNWFLSNDGLVKENVGACSESKQCRKKEQREKNESERVYKEEDKIEERAVIGINKKIDGIVHFFPRKPSRDISIFFMCSKILDLHY